MEVVSSRKSPLDQREKGGKHSISRGKGSRVAGFGAGYSPQGSR